MSILWKSDEELFALAKSELFTAVVGDVMDKLEFYHQFLPPEIQPLREDMVLIGRAMPVVAVDAFGERVENTNNLIMAKPFGLMLEALDDLKAHEIYVCTGSSFRNALWGELMSTRAIHGRAAGAVVNGYSRDTRGILKLNFPTFSRGRYAQDAGPRCKVVDFRVSVEFGNVLIRPGDIIFGDIDGVCVIPRQAEEEIFSRAIEKARSEKLVRRAIEEGMSAVKAFETFGVM
jgi:regulator of RNase E activity RraA